MGIDKATYSSIIKELDGRVKLVAVSKTRPAGAIKELYDLGQRDFGENYVQELIDKHDQLPKDICWHFIGHLQSNKIKFITPFVELIHGVDSQKLLTEINKQGQKNNRIINCLLQVHIAVEETKFGLNEEELSTLVTNINANGNGFKNVNVCGLMGMASFTDDPDKVREELKFLKILFDKYSSLIHSSPFTTLSMGMSADYKMAVEEGSNMVRIGSLIFGERNYDH